MRSVARLIETSRTYGRDLLHGVKRYAQEHGPCRRLLGRSPNEEIVRVRIEHVCNLLRETDLSLEQIAARTGFATSQYMLEVFRKTTGVTPGNYRRSLTSGER